MKELLKRILEKLACNHNWKLKTTYRKFEDPNDKMPIKIIDYYVCTKCGKIKKIRF